MNTYTTILLACVAVLSLWSAVSSNPIDSAGLDDSDDVLLPERPIRGSPICADPLYENMCERCATVSRSPTIYRMCCHNEGNAFGLCKAMVFGDKQRK